MVGDKAKHEIEVQLIGGPTALVTYGGLRPLTDPPFADPRDYDPGPTLPTQPPGPAVTAERVGTVDAVLLSHDHHPDNLDRAGREFLSGAGQVLTTTAGAERLGGNAVGLEPYAAAELTRPDGGTVRVTAVPAEHGSPE